MGVKSNAVAKRPQNAAKREHAARDPRQRQVERLMAKGRSRADIVDYCLKHYEIQPRTTDDIIRKVRDQWAAAADPLDTERRREELRQMATTGWNMARRAKRAMAVGVGDGISKIEYVDQPNHAAMAKFVEIRGKLDGVFTETTKHEAGASLAALMGECAKPTK